MPDSLTAPDAAEWRDISSAPVDQMVITYGPDGIRFSYQDSGGQWRSPMHRPKNTKPTHWQPLPSPPEAG